MLEPVKGSFCPGRHCHQGPLSYAKAEENEKSKILAFINILLFDQIEQESYGNAAPV